MEPTRWLSLSANHAVTVQGGQGIGQQMLFRLLQHIVAKGVGEVLPHGFFGAVVFLHAKDDACQHQGKGP